VSPEVLREEFIKRFILTQGIYEHPNVVAAAGVTPEFFLFR
jgi:hypothetical protein